MKKIKFKYILPLLLALVLVLGSCMTVFAADPLPVPDDSSYGYCVEVARKGEKTPYRVYYFDVQPFYRNTSGVCVSRSPMTYYYSNYADGAWSDILFRNYGSMGSGGALCICSNDDYTVLYSNHDILYEGSDEVFFRPLLAAQARVLPGVVMKHLKVILPVGVGCLALLIGSVVLLPRLRRSLLRL